MQTSSPMTMEEMMEDSPLPKSMTRCSDVEITFPTPDQDDGDDNSVPNTNDNDMSDDYDEMMMDFPAPASRKSSFDGPKFPTLE